MNKYQNKNNKKEIIESALDKKMRKFVQDLNFQEREKRLKNTLLEPKKIQYRNMVNVLHLNLNH